MRKCLIIGSPRSATTQISNIIRCNHKIKCKYASELFFNYSKSNAKLDIENAKSYINDILNNYCIIKEIIDSNLDFISSTHKYIRNYIYETNMVIIRTIRNNKLQQCLSGEIAIQTGCWHKSDKDYLSLLKHLQPISLENIKKRIYQLKKSDYILDNELKNKKHIKVEYESFYLGTRQHQDKIITEIFSSIKENIGGNEIYNIIKYGKLNNTNYYKFIPNIDKIEKEFSNIENGFLFT